MNNPLSPKVDIPFRGKGSVKCKLEVVDLFTAEMDLGVEIISNFPAFTARPASAQNCYYLYAALSSVEGLDPPLTIQECKEALVGIKAPFILKQLAVLGETLGPSLNEYYEQFNTGKTNGASDPLAGEPGGPDNGLKPSSSPGSQAKSSGVSRRGR